MDFILPSLNTYTIYTKSDCSYCTKVKELLKNESIVIVNCDEYLENRDLFLQTMDSITGHVHRTFPFVFHNSIFIGGYDDTVIYKKNSKEIQFNEDF
jgi:glutaredoxin